MSFYEMMFGHNPYALVLLKALGRKVDDFDRLRDVAVGPEHIVITTRTGGGNRPDYRDNWREIRKMPFYDYDEDADWDYTYAEICFTFPPKYKEELELIVSVLTAQGTSEEIQSAYHKLLTAVGMEIVASVDDEGKIVRRLKVVGE